VFVNKALLSGSEKLEAPLFITFYQCVVTVAACYAIKWSEGKVPGVSFPDLPLDTNILKQVGGGGKGHSVIIIILRFFLFRSYSWG
jgi:GDP-fucose transporter C1